MRYWLLLTLLLGTFDGAQRGQAVPKFEVTSVKPNAGTQQFVNFDLQPGGRLRITNASLRMVMGWAYGVQASQLAGGPDWVGRDRFDFLGKAEGNPTSDETRVMLRSLLADHFKLAFHEETREIPVYALVRVREDGKLGSQLTGSDTNCGAPSDGSPRRCEFNNNFGNIHGYGMSMELLAMSLAGFTGRVVIDRTGVTGPVNFDLTWMPPGGDGPSMFTAVQEQLGLKLEPTKAPARILVIDRAEKPRED